MSSLRASHLSGSTAVNSASTTSLASMASAATVVPPANGVVATANIINQRADASKSLYQICVTLKQRLAKVPSFEYYLRETERDAASSEYNPVESLWAVLRTGEPLLAIYNAIKPDTPINPTDITQDPAKRPKAATFKFIEACRKQLEIPPAECFIVTDLTGIDTGGFVKVIQVINHVLDLAEQRGHLLEVQSQQADSALQGPTAQMTYRDHIIRELVDTERKYVQDIENLHDLKKALVDKGVIPGDVAYQIFLNIHLILDFQRKFLIRVETTNSMPPAAQQWGAPFLLNEVGFRAYEPFIANQRKAAKVANQVFDKIQLAEHPVACDFNTLDGFLLKPMQRLAKYPLLLKDLLKRGDVPEENKAELQRGIEAAERILKKADEAVNRDLLDEALEELKVRVDDWKNHQVEQFGKLLLHGVYTVVTGRSEQEKDYEIYLFESILLCCKEVQQNKSKDKKDKNKSAMKGRNKSSKLQLKGRIFMMNVTEVLSFAKPGSYTVQIWWKGDPGVENFTVKFSNEETMKKWASGLDMQRQRNLTNSAPSPEQPAAQFTWLKNENVNNIENPYAQQEDDEEEEEQAGPSQAPSPNIGHSFNSSGGVMARNTSSNSLRARSVTNDSSQSLASLARAPPPQFPLPPPPRQLSVLTGAAQSPGPRGGESYFSPTVDSPASSRTSTASNLLNQNSQYPFPRTSTPQGGWEDRETNRYTAPAMPRAPSRDGSTTINGRNPRGPSMPVMASQQSLAQQQRSRSYSTPDINGQSTRRTNTTPVPAVPGIPPHLHPAHDASIPRSQTGSPRQDPPTRANTQSPGVQRERLTQQSSQYGGTMAQFPVQPICSRQPTPSMAQPPSSAASLGDSFGSQDLPIPTQLRVKVNCDTGTYVTLVVPFSITYQSLSDRIDGKLARFTNSSISKGILRLKYRDEDGDLVTIESDDDIQIAFLEWREGASNLSTNGVGEIELFCVGDME